MRDIQYSGPLGASKSIMNRALIIKSYFPDLEIKGHSESEDVEDLQLALSNLGQQNQFQIRDGGTSFRFLLLRLSRLPGRWKLQASRRLLSRPQEQLVNILSQLGIEVQIEGDHYTVSGNGWVLPPQALLVERSQSSQFASSLILNSPQLKNDLKIRMQGEKISDDYLQMTLRVCQDLGLSYVWEEDELKIQAWQKLSQRMYEVGADLSSVFSLCSFAAVRGQVTITNLVCPELQPDSQFIPFFQEMGISTKITEHQLHVQGGNKFKGIVVNLASCPDLFPVLTCLCATAETPSRLFGAPQLRFKESDRLEKTYELLKKCRVPFKPLPDGIEIQGQSLPHTEIIEFNPDRDHRMAMAAALMKYSGWTGLKIQDSVVVKKSFPNFWDVSGIQP